MIMKLKLDYKDYIDEIKRRRIEYLIHFTPTRNLYGIYDHKKILSRAILEKLDIEQFDILDYIQFTDNIRYDDKTFINLSISAPNTFLFSKFRKITKDDCTISWSVLKIKPKHIYEIDTLFSVTNAGSNDAKRIGITGDYDKFKMLFADYIDIRHGRRGRLKACYTTNVQAEVLVKDCIPIESIVAVCIESQSKLAETKAALSRFDTSKFIVDSEIFSPNREL